MISLHDDTRRLARMAVVLAITFALAACGKDAAKDDHAAEGGAKAEHAGEKKEEDHKEGEEALTLTADEATRAGIKVEEMQPQALGETVVVTATIQPDQDRLARLGPRIEGRITAVPAKLGDSVRAGQTLALLESVEVGAAHANWVQAQAELRITDASLKRAESLIAEEIIPRKDYLRAQADRDQANSAVRAAAERLRLLGGNPAATGNAVSAFAVTAPFAGTIIEKKATMGELASPSETLFAVADLSRVWIQAALPEVALAKVRVGAAATVTVPAYPDETFSGRVGLIGAALDKDTRTVAARIEVANADGRLKPEMFATATIEVAGDKRNVFALPDAAIVLLEGKPHVFVFEQGAYEEREIEPGERIAGRTVLKSGVKAGDQVVTEGTYALKARKLKSQLGHGH